MCSVNLASILIVDDQENWRKALKRALKDTPYYVSVAKGFEEGQSQLSKRSFDLVVLDVRMEDDDIFNVDGLALLNYVKEKYPNARTILLTGYPDSVKDKANVDAFILKVPLRSTFDEEEFRNVVERLINQANNENEEN